MEIKPEMIKQRTFEDAGVVVSQVGNLYMVESWVNSDVDGNGYREARQFFDWADAMDKYSVMETEEDIFWEFGFSFENYQMHLQGLGINT
jgi:hypothetical protein